MKTRHDLFEGKEESGLYQIPININKASQALHKCLGSLSERAIEKLALEDPRWRKVMQDKVDAMLKNETWELVPKSPKDNVVNCI